MRFFLVFVILSLTAPLIHAGKISSRLSKKGSKIDIKADQKALAQIREKMDEREIILNDLIEQFYKKIHGFFDCID